MLKALLMASVIIGAFLFQPAAYSQESGSNPCPLGGSYLVYEGQHICYISSQLSDEYRIISVRYGTTPGTFYDTISQFLEANTNPNACDGVTYPPHRNQIGTFANGCHITSFSLEPGFIPEQQQTFNFQRYVTTTTYSITCSFQGGIIVCNQNPPSTNTTTANLGTSLIVNAVKEQAYQCPPDGQPQFNQGPFVTESGQNLCFYPAATPDNDNECPPGTVGDCDEPPEEPQCSIGGNGMEVCPADPNEKCSSYQHEGKTFYDCPSNCGFIQDQFFCTTEPDSDGEIPDMSNCFKVATGWACPPDSPTPDDNIDNPEKTLPDMTKGDFKETNKGVETRLDATNSLLGDIAGTGEATNQGIADLNAKALAANGILSQIRQNTGATAGNTADIKDALTGDGMDLDDNHRGLIGGALGITGDESIDDLTKEEITLDSFRSEFQWSGGGGSCPAPRQINILGASFQMDWQPYCEAFAVASHFILAAAYFFAAFIAFGGRK